MPDPITAPTIAAITQSSFGATLFKLLAYIIGPSLAAAVVMSMTQPRTPREWVAAISSTLACSLGLGSYLIINHFTAEFNNNELLAMQAGAIYFVSGLPGWFLVRALFHTFDQYQNANIFEVWKTIKNQGSRK